MKLYDIKIGRKGKDDKTFWRTIGTVFAGDEAHLKGQNDKPLGFSIDYPECQGIIVPREAKKKDE